jgi:hypothetical protein
VPVQERGLEKEKVLALVPELEPARELGQVRELEPARELA